MFFASLVLISHAWVLGGFSKTDPAIVDLSLGGWAVGGFFGISGFLITGSRVRSDFSPYIWRRILRIFPGLWVRLFIVAFVFVPIGALAEAGPNHIGPGDIVKFLVANGALTNRDFGIGGTLQHVPFPGSWDGSL